MLQVEVDAGKCQTGKVSAATLSLVRKTLMHFLYHIRELHCFVLRLINDAANPDVVLLQNKQNCPRKLLKRLSDDSHTTYRINHLGNF